MWEVLKRAPRGRISLRNLSLLATGLFVAILLNFGFTNTALAAEASRTADGGFVYEQKAFTNPTTIKPGDPRVLATPSTGDMTAYEHMNAQRSRVEYIYFTSSQDPKTATTASYVTFDYSPPNNYTNRSPITGITINDAPPILDSDNVGQTTCSVTGLGWLICPVGGFIAFALDGMYSLMMTFLDVKPMLAGSATYDIWNALRSIANIVFVIVFLIIIFSQVSSLGISAYGIRKMLPRLIVAAILVNLSFVISALAVDLSNYLGHAIYALVSGLAKSLDSAALSITWEDLTMGILAGLSAGGGIVAGGLWFSAATAGSLGALWFTLLGMLISVGLAVLTALVILFVRQALIIILVLISPFAFVAMVMPSTEKWYKKWFDAFMAMLLMYPIFSFVFSGAMLAGAAIIASADGNIFLVLLGKGVQLLPLAVTPLIVRFSTGILGTIAQFTNNKNKGIIDRAKNWTDSQADHHRKKLLAGRAGRNAQRSSVLNPFRWTAQRFDDTTRRQKMEQQGFEDAADARAMTGGGNNKRLTRYRNSYNYARSMGLEKETADNELKGGYDYLRRTDSDTVLREIRRRESEIAAKKESESIDRMHAEIAAEGGNNANLRNLNIQDTNLRNAILTSANAIKVDTEDIAFTGIAKKMAERTHQDNISTILETSPRTVNGVDVRKFAGGIQGRQGENAALAYAVATKRKQFGESVAEMNELIKHYAPDSGDLQSMIIGQDRQGNRVTQARGVRRDARGNVVSTFDFDRSDIFAMEAAIENNVAIGTVDMVDQIMQLSGSELSEYRTTISSALAKAGHSGRSIYQGGRLINEVAQGRIASPEDLTKYIQGQILDGKFSAAQLAKLDKPAAARFLEAASTQPLDPGVDPVRYAASVRRLAQKVHVALTSDQTRDEIKENTIPVLRDIHALDPSLGPPPTL